MLLPTGLTARPLAMTDARSVYELMAASEVHDVGEVVIEEADIVSDWQRPSFDVGAHSVGVLDGERLVAYAEVSVGGRADASVHPSYRGRGLGSALARWTQEEARRQGETVVGMPVPEGSDGERLLRALGYHVRWTSWVLQLPPGAVIEAQPLPAGYRVREAAGEGDYRRAYEIMEDAFLEWSVRDRASYDEWAAGVMLRPGFEPWNLRLVTGPAEQVVGMVFVVVSDGCGFIVKLAVSAGHRHRGLARALLADGFGVAREHGGVRSELSTDSRTGALALYEKVGMVVTSRWHNLAIAV